MITNWLSRVMLMSPKRHTINGQLPTGQGTLVLAEVLSDVRTLDYNIAFLVSNFAARAFNFRHFGFKWGIIKYNFHCIVLD